MIKEANLMVAGGDLEGLKGVVGAPEGNGASVHVGMPMRVPGLGDDDDGWRGGVSVEINLLGAETAREDLGGDLVGGGDQGARGGGEVNEMTRVKAVAGNRLQGGGGIHEKGLLAGGD